MVEERGQKGGGVPHDLVGVLDNIVFDVLLYLVTDTRVLRYRRQLLSALKHRRRTLADDLGDKRGDRVANVFSCVCSSKIRRIWWYGLPKTGLCYKTQEG